MKLNLVSNDTFGCAAYKNRKFTSKEIALVQTKFFRGKWITCNMDKYVIEFYESVDNRTGKYLHITKYEKFGRTCVRVICYKKRSVFPVWEQLYIIY